MQAENLAAKARNEPWSTFLAEDYMGVTWGPYERASWLHVANPSRPRCRPLECLDPLENFKFALAGPTQGATHFLVLETKNI